MARGHDPSRKRRGFRVTKRSKAVVKPKALPPEPEALETTYSYPTGGVDMVTVTDARSISMLAKLEDLAPLLWSSDYRPLYEQERAELEKKASLITAGSLLQNLVEPSTYQKRYRASEANQLKRDGQAWTDVGLMASCAYRQANERNCTFSTLARTVEALGRRTSYKQWERLRKRKETYDRKWAYKIVEIMMKTRPEPEGMMHSAIGSFIVDQKYIKKGKSRGEHRAAEQVDASGDLLELVAFVYVNVIKVPVPFALAPLTPAEILELQETGPYTRDPSRVKLVLDIDVVKASVVEMFVESMGFVKQIMARAGVARVRDLSTPLIARSQCGRPAVKCAGATHWELGPPVLGNDDKGCDTKSQKDVQQYLARVREMQSPGSAASEQLAWYISRLPADMQASMSVPCAATMQPRVAIVRGDGQTNISTTSEKVRDPAGAKDIVSGPGDFHSSGHGSFCSIEGLYDSKYGRSLRVLHKTKIPKHIPNFEDDSYLHATTFIREDYVGTLCYFLQDVLRPPPELLIDDPVSYRDQLQDAGAMAAFDSMMYGGVPQCHWQLAARSEDGEKCVKLRAFEFHKMRAWAHKPVEARVLLIALLSTEATHPMISEVVKHLNFFSWLGRDGASVFSDKAIEMVHRFQSERAGKFTSFDHALHHSPEIVALMHVMHALDVLENGESSAVDPLRQSTINAAEVIRKDLVKTLGTDLTIPNPHNRLFFTSGSGPDTVNSNASCSHRPVEWLWRVAEGRSTGPGRKSPESSNTYLDRFLTQRLWTKLSED